MAGIWMNKIKIKIMIKFMVKIDLFSGVTLETSATTTRRRLAHYMQC